MRTLIDTAAKIPCPTASAFTLSGSSGMPTARIASAWMSGAYDILVMGRAHILA